MRCAAGDGERTRGGEATAKAKAKATGTRIVEGIVKTSVVNRWYGRTKVGEEVQRVRGRSVALSIW